MYIDFNTLYIFSYFFFLQRSVLCDCRLFSVDVLCLLLALEVVATVDVGAGHVGAVEPEAGGAVAPAPETVGPETYTLYIYCSVEWRKREMSSFLSAYGPKNSFHYLLKCHTNGARERILGPI